MKKRMCPGCGYQGNIYDFSPSIEIEDGDFRIFHFYNEMKGPLYCIQCKRKHLVKISSHKHLTKKQILFLKTKIKEESKKFSKNLLPK